MEIYARWLTSVLKHADIGMFGAAVYDADLSSITVKQAAFLSSSKQPSHRLPYVYPEPARNFVLKRPNCVATKKYI